MSTAPRPWTMLALGMAAQGASCVFMYGLPVLVPVLRGHGLSLGQAGLIVGAPSAGMLFTLVAWGWVADRFGERVTMSLGQGLAGVVLAIAAVTHPSIPVTGLLLGLAGALGSSANSASGKVVLGWFPPERRGVAMAFRQAAQPLGIAVAALALPPVAAAHGLPGALGVLAAVCLVTSVVVAIFVVDPPRGAAAGPANGRNPYRLPDLWRIHGAAMLLVVPQFTTAAFTYDYLVAERGWDAALAGQLLAGVQIFGALCRVACGRWSDAVGSRLRPMRQLAVVNGLVGLLAAAAIELDLGVSPALLIGALVVAMAGNGFAFTAVAELAGSAWAGRALGVHNMVQNIVGALTPGLIGALIAGNGYAVGIGLAALFALVSVPITPADRRPVAEPAAA
ncbi:MAG: MFS transporter [Hamadaea sp.]|nr:MFS transporter [Hamadaea sp.]